VVPIKDLKRFVADYKYSHVPGGIYPPLPMEEGEHIKLAKKVAVVGSGPAGCAAAMDLGSLGYNVTIFESNDAPGGMLSHGIPEYRLSKKVVELEIENIRSYGVAIETSKKVEDAESLRKMGFDIIVLAAGAQKDLRLPIPGIDMVGVLSCMPFLRDVNWGNKKELSGTVIVIGGGSSALDCARVAKRLGAEKVEIAYRRTITEMPAMKEEITEANEEGIEIMELVIPTKVLGEDHVTGLEFLKAQLGDEDESGRRRPIPQEGTEFEIKADTIITAVGFTSDIKNFSEDLILTDQGTVKVDSQGRTNVEDIFAAGDVVLGPSSIIEAIASGHDAAHGVHLKLSNEKEQPSQFRMMPVIIDEPVKDITKAHIKYLDPQERESNFHEVKLGFSESSALTEAARCIRCASCFECSVCLGECNYKQVAGTIGDRSFLIKCPTDFSSSTYQSSKEMTLSGDSKENKILIESITAKVDSGYCIACGRCEEACSYQAVRVCIKKDEPPTAHVDHDSCKCCGACSAVCPTGAISQGPMSPDNIRGKIGSLAKRSEPGVYGCVWGKKSPLISDNEVIFMCTRMIRPSMILEGLASGILGILINPCSHNDGCHYFPFEPSIEEIACKTNDLLEYIGFTSKRVRVKSFPSVEKEFVVNEFSQQLKELDVQPIPQLSFEGNNRISRTLNWLSKVHSSDNEEETTCRLALFHLFFDAEGFDVLKEMVDSVENLIGKKIVEKEIEKITMGSLLDKMKIPDEISKDCTLGLVPSSENGLDLGKLKNMLGQISGLNVITLKPSEKMDLDKLNSRTKAQALDLIKDAEEKNIDILIPLSIADYAQLKLFLRTGSWLTTNILVKDIFSALFQITGDFGGEV
jgi:NADPH-dependent glutamate synthase beta subunit-like oxidoreductase/coenzyme F420-reducing hydrogenase delta subunit/NAD-dependent dihydropyrimidine dehydrogenase PreA subunit